MAKIKDRTIATQFTNESQVTLIDFGNGKCKWIEGDIDDLDTLLFEQAVEAPITKYNTEGPGSLIKYEITRWRENGKKTFTLDIKKPGTKSKTATGKARKLMAVVNYCSGPCPNYEIACVAGKVPKCDSSSGPLYCHPRTIVPGKKSNSKKKSKKK